MDLKLPFLCNMKYCIWNLVMYPNSYNILLTIQIGLHEALWYNILFDSVYAHVLMCGLLWFEA